MHWVPSPAVRQATSTPLSVLVAVICTGTQTWLGGGVVGVGVGSGAMILMPG